MKRLLVIGRALAVAMLATWFAAGDAAASHPDILRNYRFIPSHSTLEQTGGFAGVDLSYHLFGTFGLVTGFEEGVACMAIGCPPPDHIPFADFVDVRAYALWNHPAAFPPQIPLEDFIDLEALDGTFHLGDPNHLFFHGEDAQGQRFRLEATLRGRLLHMRGESIEQCCDFFQYKLDALAYLTPHADFNLDGAVDAADYVLWRKTLGQTGAGVDADGNDNGDYDLWRAHFGDAVDFSEFTEASLGSNAIPEPATLLLFILGVLALTCGRRRLRC